MMDKQSDLAIRDSRYKSLKYMYAWWISYKIWLCLLTRTHPLIQKCDSFQTCNDGAWLSLYNTSDLLGTAFSLCFLFDA